MPESTVTASPPPEQKLAARGQPFQTLFGGTCARVGAGASPKNWSQFDTQLQALSKTLSEQVKWVEQVSVSQSQLQQQQEVVNVNDPEKFGLEPWPLATAKETVKPSPASSGPGGLTRVKDRLQSNSKSSVGSSTSKPPARSFASQNGNTDSSFLQDAHAAARQQKIDQLMQSGVLHSLAQSHSQSILQPVLAAAGRKHHSTLSRPGSGTQSHSQSQSQLLLGAGNAGGSASGNDAASSSAVARFAEQQQLQLELDRLSIKKSSARKQTSAQKARGVAFGVQTQAHAQAQAAQAQAQHQSRSSLTNGPGYFTDNGFVPAWKSLSLTLHDQQPNKNNSARKSNSYSLNMNLQNGR